MMIKDLAVCGFISISTEMDTIYTNTKLYIYLDECVDSHFWAQRENDEC